MVYGPHRMPTLLKVPPGSGGMAKHYMLTYARPRIDRWDYGEAICTGEHPLEWVAKLRETEPGVRLVTWQRISPGEKARLVGLARPVAR